MKVILLTWLNRGVVFNSYGVCLRETVVTVYTPLQCVHTCVLWVNVHVCCFKARLVSVFYYVLSWKWYLFSSTELWQSASTCFKLCACAEPAESWAGWIVQNAPVFIKRRHRTEWTSLCHTQARLKLGDSLDFFLLCWFPVQMCLCTC